MSSLKGSLGAWKLEWLSIPRGDQGSARIRVGKTAESGEVLEVRWRRDEDGIWIELPHGVFGFDVVGELDDDSRIQYRLNQRGDSASWSGLKFARAGEQTAVASVDGRKKPTRVRAQMPGKIVRVMVKPGDAVEKDQVLLVMEAMKMENQIRAPQAGSVTQVLVKEAQAVETGADLVQIGAPA